jgi:hypothetical protein
MTYIFLTLYQMFAALKKRASSLATLYSDKASMVPVILNTVAAIVLLIVLFSIMGHCVKNDMYKLDVNNSYKRKIKTVIHEGYTTAANLNKIVYDTNHPVLDSTNNFMNIAASYNLKGGAQYSYRFWIRSADPDANAYKTILVRGVPKRFRVHDISIKRSSTNTSQDIVVVKQPLIRFGASSRDFVMEFNTTAQFTEKISLDSSDYSAESNGNISRNISSLFDQTWVMLTWVLEDNIPIDDFENGVCASIYINDFMYVKKVFKGALKMNRGPLCLFTDTEVAAKETYIGDITYYNYALKGKEVASEFGKGLPYKQDNIQGNAHEIFSPNKANVYSTG